MLFNFSKVIGLGCLCLFTGKLEAQTKSAVLYGTLHSERDTIRLRMSFNAYPVNGMGMGENIFRNVPVDASGRFRMEIPATGGPGLLYVYDSFTMNNLLASQIVEPGDSVQVNGKITDDAFTGVFSGKGGAKYTCTQALHALQVPDGFYDSMDVQKLNKLCRARFSAQDSVLNRFKSRLTPLVYRLLQTEARGEILSAQIQYARTFGALQREDTPPAQKQKVQKALKAFMPETLALPADVAAFSVQYVNYLYQRTKANLLAEKNKSDIRFGDLYAMLKTGFTGTLRDRLLAFCISNGLDLAIFYQVVDANDYTSCLKDAEGLIKDQRLKDYVTRMLHTRGKGAAAFPFKLPADSSQRIVSLNDLKGKVLLVDIWGYQCTGCMAFSNIFHEKVLPRFRDDPRFAVVSIMGDGSTYEGYMHRLRDPEGYHYTFPTNINLYGTNDGEKSSDIAKHYSVNAWPFILLIGKDGKVYSSTPPFFTTPNSPNIERLTQLIRKAIDE